MKTLLYCGIDNIASFIAMRPNYDIVYCFDANPHKIDHLKSIFNNDADVHTVHCYIDTEGSKNVAYTFKKDKYSSVNNYNRISADMDSDLESSAYQQINVVTCNIADYCEQHSIRDIDTLVTCVEGPSLKKLLKALEKFIKHRDIKEIHCEYDDDTKEFLFDLLSNNYDLIRNHKIDIKGECSFTQGHWRQKEIVLSKDGTGNTFGRDFPAINDSQFYIFNMVYAHGPAQQEFAMRRGNVSVVFSSVPISNCHLYVSVNAYSFYGKQDGDDILFLSEPAVVLPGQFNKDIWKHFNHVFTHYDYLIEKNANFSKLLIYRSGWLWTDDAVTENIDERHKKYPLADKRHSICMINGNKKSCVPGELYSLRLQAAEWFDKNSDVPFDVYGNPPFTLPNYKGVIPPGMKLKTLAQYKFCLCFENTNHPLLSLGYADKILDCMETRTIPIYYGAPNVEKYIPSDCFIDYRDFTDINALNRYLENMPDNEYLDYVNNIDKWVSRGGLRPYSMHTFYDQLCHYFSRKKGIELAALFGSSQQWDNALIPEEAKKFMSCRQSIPYWNWDFLSQAPLSIIAGDEKIDQYHLFIEKARSLEKQGRFNEALDEIERAFSNGIIDAKDLILCANLYIKTKQFNAAEKKLLQVIAIDPAYAKAYDDLGVICYQSGELKRAMKYFIDAFTLDNLNYNALRNILALAQQLGIPEAAYDIVRKRLKEFPHDDELRAIAENVGITDHQNGAVAGHLFLSNPKNSNHSLKEDFLRSMASLTGVTVFVETGTFMGGTTLEAARIFPSVHTIELSEELYQQAQPLFAGRDNIHTYQGDSGKLFPELLKTIEGKIIFWLDGHYSEGITAKSEKNSPILEELEAIKKANIPDAVILIDDLRMFPNSWTRIPAIASLQGYPTITLLLKAIRDICSAYSFIVFGDVLLAYPPGEPIIESPILKACTMSRLFEESDTDVEKLIDAEKNIGNASGEELLAIRDLFASLSPEGAGLGEHYRLWYALVLKQHQQYPEACEQLQISLNGGFTHWRIHWYLAQAAHQSGDLALARREVQEALCMAPPDFTNAQTLLKEMDIQLRQYLSRDKILSRIAINGLWQEGKPLRLHLGCGENHFDGYINIDFPPSEHSVQKNAAADLFADITLLAFPMNTVDEIRLHHVFEHFSRSKALALLIQWHSWLKIGGKLHIETPDVIGSARTLVADMPYRIKQGVLRHAFGSHEASWAYHLDGWYKEKFEHILSKLGFSVQCHNVQWEREPWLSNVHALAVKEKQIDRETLLGIADEILLDSMVADVPGERLMHQVWCRMVRDELGKMLPDKGSTVPPGVGIAAITIKNDTPAYDNIGYDNTEFKENGEFNVLSKIVQQQAQVIFDIGANKGHWSKLVMEMAPHATIYAFEPVPETYSLMQQNLKTTNVHLYNLAISEYDGAKTFYHWDDNAQTGELSSFYRRPDVEKNMNASVKPITVQSYALDTFCREQSIREIDFLKIDTEGAELDVISGAASLLSAKRIRILQFEYGGTYLDSGITLKQIYVLLQKYSYSVFRIIPEGLLHIPLWRDVFENYRYANYIAVAPDMMDAFDSSQSAEQVKGVISGAKNYTPVTTVIFSKDRAMQLDATLRSLRRHCNDAEDAYMTLKIIYLASTARYNDQYEELKQTYLSAQFIPEKNFRDDLLLALSNHEYVMFLVDDNLFVSDFKLADAVESLEKCPNAIGFSFRLGKNTSYCYMLGRQQRLPDFIHRDKLISRYNWTTADLDFGYPLELSSSLYRIKDIMPLLDRIDFENPNTLELQLETNKSSYASEKPEILCFDQSVAFCNPINMVQSMWANKSGKNNDYTAEKLSDLFAQGHRIYIDRFSGFVPNSCHQEVAFEFTSAQPAGEVSSGTVLRSTAFVTIGIVNWNGLKHIQGCLESIRRNTPEPHEIIVVDNGSSDGSREYLRTQTDIILVENTENMGAPGARNQFLSIARGDYIVFLDNDTFVTQDWLKKLIAHMGADPQIGIIGACSNYATGLQGIPGVAYKTIDELEEYAKKRAQEHRGELLPSPRLISFCVFVRRAAVEKIGAMETGFSKFCFEDDDYALRISIAGFKSVVANDVFIHHTGGPQGRGDKQYNKWLYDAWDGFKRKWGLPQALPFGSAYDAVKIASQPFDPKVHYIPLYDPASIEPLIWRATSVLEKPRIFPSDAAKEIPSLIHPEFIEGMTSIIIPVQSIHLSECVSSLKKYTEEPHEIILLNHSVAPKVKKGLKKVIKDNGDCKIVEIDNTVNFTQSLNVGINQSTGEYIVLLFDDVVVGEGWLADMLEYLHSDKKIGIVGAMSDDASSLQRVEGIDFKSLEELTSFRERNRHRRIQTRNIDGFCLLFRRNLLVRVGLFDEIFDNDKYLFDDFCVRAVLEGYNNIIAGNLFVHNLGGINRLMSRDKTLFDEKWIGLDASTPLAEKVLIANAMEMARSQYHKGAIDDAIITLIGRIGFSPQEKQLYYQLVEMLLAENRFQDALDALKGMGSVEDEVEYYELLGYGNEGLGYYQVAEEYADNALAIDGKSAPALNLKGILSYRNDDMSKAEEFFRRAIEADPGFGEPYTNIGMMKWKTEQNEEAVDHFEKGFVLSPDKGDIITGYYAAISSLELYGRAEIIFREARTAYPENKRILFLLIDILLKQNKFPEAMQEAEKAMVLLGIDEGILSAALEIRRKIGAKSIAVKDGKAKAAPTLSVCMIVKNEERHLAYCLNSLSPIADEMIVVDTGSTDKSREIADAFGAQVYDFEWINDFAAARNHSLSKATGDWILVMDADEVISFQDHAKLKKLISRKDKVAYNLISRNYINRTAGDGWMCNDNTYIHEQAGRGWFPSGKVRLFPNNAKIRFENPIHELVEYSLVRIGVGRQESGIPVHHYGELDAQKATEKDAQYYELGVQKMKESSGDFRSVWELAVQAGELGKIEESIELWHKVLGFKQREAAAYFNLANHYLQLRKYEDSYACSRKSYALDPLDQSAVLSYAMSEFLAGDINKTIATLEGFLRGTDSQTSHVGLLAVSYLISGEKDRGLKYLRGLVKKKYNCVHYLKDLAQSLIGAGNLARAKSLLTTAIEIKFYDQETSVLLAKCEVDEGNKEHAIK